MKRKAILSVVCIATSIIVSCSKGNADTSNPDDLKTKAITMAENAIDLKESPIIGTLPSIYAQRKAALDSVSNMSKKSFEVINPQSKEEIEKAVAEAEKINMAAGTAKNAIKAHYDAKLQESGKPFIGKEFKSQFDKNQYSASSVKITKFEGATCYAEANLTLSAPLGRTRCVVYRFLDEHGNIVSNGANYNLSDDGNYEAGGKITMQISAALPSMAKIASVKFVKD